MNINQVQRDYELNDIELLCISSYLHTDSKVYSYSQTVGKTSKSKHIGILASRWFSQPKIEKYLFDYEQKKIIQNNIARIKGKVKDNGMFDANQNTQKVHANVTNIATNNYNEITSENIKQKLEQLINQVDDPKDKLQGLIKVAEFVGVNKSEIDLTTPTIYLPQRCSQCEYKNKSDK